jgi:hypothetical protein
MRKVLMAKMVVGLMCRLLEIPLGVPLPTTMIAAKYTHPQQPSQDRQH